MPIPSHSCMHTKLYKKHQYNPKEYFINQELGVSLEAGF